MFYFCDDYCITCVGFALKPIVNATDDEPTIGTLDKAEYFNIDEDGVLSGLSRLGKEYADEYNYLDIIIPEGVTVLRGMTITIAIFTTTHVFILKMKVVKGSTICTI
ncbi:MAG: hypothetical protein MJ054_00155 [Clostridia bacterium]|nr:hypothetical protein [Clostridia bacterium]